MANLVPLNIDKDTGRIVARFRPFGPGFGPPFGGTGFLYEQFVPSDDWVVAHNQENDRVLVQIYDDTGEFTLPQGIFIIDINTIRITFGAPMEGTAHIFFFNSQQ